MTYSKGNQYRVRLFMEPGIDGSDYINASHIDVSIIITNTVRCAVSKQFSMLRKKFYIV